MEGPGQGLTFDESVCPPNRTAGGGKWEEEEIQACKQVMESVSYLKTTA
jgi:hypothetical protein